MFIALQVSLGKASFPHALDSPDLLQSLAVLSAYQSQFLTIRNIGILIPLRIRFVDILSFDSQIAQF